MKNALYLALLFPSCLLAAEEYGSYFSPGLRIGWDFSGGLTFGGKISVGVLRDADLNNSMFFNVTVGFKAPISGKQKLWYREYNFVQAQFGLLAKRDTGFFIGGGLGMASLKHNPAKRKPMLTLFAGSLIFAETDFIFDRDRLVSTDFGLLAILPIPLTGFDFDFN